MFATFVAADARGGLPFRERVHTAPENGLGYLLVLAFCVTFVGVLASIGV
jgi:hypothetical protein